MKRRIRYVAELSQVREVSLVGAVELDYWKERLRPAGLAPAEKNGRGHVLIVGGDASFAGVRFREVSFSILLSTQGMQPWHDAACLMQAFNSSALFTASERVFFSTPYCHGDVTLTCVPAALEVVKGGTVVFRARMQSLASAPERQPSFSGEDGWHGPVFLPEKKAKENWGKLFFARIQGHTTRHPFLDSVDSVSITPSVDTPVFQALLDSRFVPEEWIIRQDAFHGKSKTYRREKIFGD